MRWTERLLGLSAGNAGTVPEPVARLPVSLTQAVGSLAHCANLAPSTAAEAELRRLTERAEVLRGRIRDALAALAVPVSQADARTDVPLGRNHWARLVATLEQHREIRSQLLEAAVALSETNPELGAELQQLGREEGMIIEQLRNLIARADPQASD